MKTLDLNRIIELSEVHHLKIKNVYVFGSQVYGYAKPESDFDIVLVAPGLIGKEIKDPQYNIHHILSDVFKSRLKEYNIQALECYFAPEWAILQEKEKYVLDFNKSKMIASFLTQSNAMWKHSKFKMLEGDINRSMKSAFHSIKTLMFGIDIIQHSKITDFDLTKFHDDFFSEYYFEWKDLKNAFFDMKVFYENKLKDCK
jgi:predicted nucleotidyltransferase